MTSLIDKAIADYTRAIILNPNYAEAYYNRGIAWYKKDDYDQAIRDNLKVIELNQQNADAHYNLACLNALLKRPKDACKWLRKSIELKEELREYARSDKDLNLMREHECFKELIE